MATPIEKIAQEVVELSRRERVALMRHLRDLDQPSKGGEIEKAWDQEIRARAKAVDEGRVAGIAYDQIKQEMTGRFRARAQSPFPITSSSPPEPLRKPQTSD
jgi:putative addiction module component (TIGR02574 family)